MLVVVQALLLVLPEGLVQSQLCRARPRIHVKFAVITPEARPESRGHRTKGAHARRARAAERVRRAAARTQPDAAAPAAAAHRSVRLRLESGRGRLARVRERVLAEERGVVVRGPEAQVVRGRGLPERACGVPTPEVGGDPPPHEGALPVEAGRKLPVGPEADLVAGVVVVVVEVAELAMVVVVEAAEVVVVVVMAVLLLLLDLLLVEQRRVGKGGQAGVLMVRLQEVHGRFVPELG